MDRTLRGALVVVALVMASMAVSHEVVYFLAYGAGGEFARAMRAGGHDGYWLQFLLTVAGVTLALSAVAVRQLHRLRGQAAAVRAGRLVVDDTGWAVLARMTGHLWLLIAAGTTLAYLAQENIEVFAVAGRLPGLDVVTGGQVAAIPVIALASLIVAVVGGLMRWRRQVLLARIQAARAPIRRTPTHSPRPVSAVRPRSSTTLRSHRLRAPPESGLPSPI